MSAMTRDLLSNELVLVVRAAHGGRVVDTADAQFILSGGCNLPIRIETAPRWQPHGLLRDEDATWEDAEWQ